MIRLLKPRLFVQSIYDLDLAGLVGRGIRGLILDLDNTLVGWNQPHAPRELLDWFQRVQQQGIKTYIVSNNWEARVTAFSRLVGVAGIAKAAKPRRWAFRQAMAAMGTEHETTAVIGDQIFTDILGGNRLNLFTILVHPMDSREFWTTRIVRRIERALVAESLSSGA
ncbi:HAD superfamily (subfamily IIIA) phosphatase, TIGR01668 [Sulfobacillus acidophilus DSM 10332]|uniref:HAD superfamily (Subfamily IIIA) phosphatase, TIGR01668 n=1 Tax=Sulfobacillus acidophilus (strain ATCC 700253 / DSM 10332 / NAL) TaxID=679936 RepID=G8TYC8_SULAD|nr:HAD superfamily (subfamily IIIA) phosphatase, TIGR01668 [Sulfobacillus acidophilus DSM 10332]